MALTKILCAHYQLAQTGIDFCKAPKLARVTWVHFGQLLGVCNNIGNDVQETVQIIRDSSVRHMPFVCQERSESFALAGTHR